MRAIIVELTGDDSVISSDAETVEATRPEDEAPRPAPTKADGTLAERKPSREEYDSTEREPW